jgi:transcriptional regulator with GAF, ATPase, and Fis domain/predicted ATPase
VNLAEIPGYRVRAMVGGDDLQVLVRAVRQSDGAAVLLKRTRSAPAAPMEVASLRRERDVLAELQGAGIPRVVASEPDLLVFEDRGGLPLPQVLAGKPLPASHFPYVARRLAELVGRVHEAGLVHRGLRAAALLVDDKLEIELVEWSTASRLTDDAEGAAAGAAGGRPCCFSPEQTGRMNRGVDHRADFYALGAIFYELLTGRPPFETRDPLELVHWHIARIPIAPAALHSGTSLLASQITMKLLAKMAEDRYQSASGLLADLMGLDPGATGSTDTSISLGAHDEAERFTPPQRLIGREREQAQLNQAFEQAAAGETVVAFVGGQAGVGKTAVISELGKAVAARGGHFASGKFDQLERGRPYSALAQALGDLCQQPRGASADVGRPLGETLREALGPNAGVLTSLVPELETLVGPTAAALALGPTETQNRLAWAFQNLLAVLARPESPLVVLLDDVQWADVATLRLLSSAIGRGAALPILWVIAYRDSEVSSDHPLTRLRQELRQHAAELRDLTISPLRPPDLVEFLAGCFGAHDVDVDGLARILADKTDGNPFFVIQFLKSLERDGLLAFDRAARRWHCDLVRVAGAALADNVVDLMTRKLRHLPAATRTAVAAGAYVGNPFSLETLALVRRQPQREVAADLWEAIAEGLLRPSSLQYEILAGSDALENADIEYRFSHDRVQQAAHALVPEGDRADLHLQVGRLLWSKLGDGADRVFDIVGHLNRSMALISDPDERRRLARLDRTAGRQARASGAVARALELFEAGLTLAPLDGATDELAWSLALDAAECQLVCGRAEEGDRALEDIAARAPDPDLAAEALRIRIVYREDTGRFGESARLGAEALARFGVSIPTEAAERSALLEGELARIDELMAGRSIASLSQLPRMTDPATMRVTALIVAMWPSAFLTNEAGLTALLSAHLVRLSLEHGNAEESAIGYVTHAITVNARTRDYARGNELGLLGLAINDQFGDVRLRAKVHHLFGSFLAPWGQALPAGRRHGREAHQAAIETGDLTYAGRAAFMQTWYGFFPGDPLVSFEEEAQAAVAFLERIGHHAVRQAAQILVQWSRALRGVTSGPCLSGEGFDEAAFEQTFRGVPIFLGFLGVAQMGIAYLFEDHRRAWELGARAALAFGDSAEQIWHSVLDFYRGLAAAAVLGDEPEAPAVLNAAIERLRQRSQGCAANFEHQHLLLAAERARAHEGAGDAARLYAQAAAAADGAGFLNDRALVYERMARFEAEQGHLQASRAHMVQALSLYRQWGAVAKARDLEAKFPDLTGVSKEMQEHPDLSFDAASALKAAQAIAAEIELDRLVPRLVSIVIENAGAERGVLLEAADEELVVLAEGTVGRGGAALQPLPVEHHAELPLALVRRVHRTGSAIVVRDARADTQWRYDPYVARRKPRSILCVPIARQGSPRGVLYLENTLSADVFTVARAGVVQVLAGQAAISLENARLYRSMREEVRRRSEAETALTGALADLETLKNRLQAENVYLQEEIRTQHNFDEIVGNSPQLLEALGKVEKVAPTDSTVLVLGETGTGKELVARAIHSRSGRRDRPLVKVNCAAIATGLVESELFGHAKGAFTGALQKRVGRFELADGGTIFLDEVGELPLDTQAKLLRVLQEQEFEPVGSSRTQRVDVRVIAATNRNLDAAVAEGRFRADLLYRLNAFPVEIPPLRRRREDIPVLASFFLDRFAKRLGTTIEGFRQTDMQRLVSWPWPGNVRELQNVVERAAILARNHVPTLDTTLPAASATGPDAVEVAGGASDGSAIEDVERAHIISVLRRTSWVVEGVRGAASILKLHPNTLRSRMKKLGIARQRSQSDR